VLAFHHLLPRCVRASLHRGYGFETSRAGERILCGTLSSGPDGFPVPRSVGGWEAAGSAQRRGCDLFAWIDHREGGEGRKRWLEAEPAGACVGGNVGSGRGGAIKSGFNEGNVGPEVKIGQRRFGPGVACAVKEPPRSAWSVVVMASGPRV
jgi:hypothetical protein